MSCKSDSSKYANKHRYIPTLPTIYEDSQYMKPSHTSDAALCPREERVEPGTWATGNHHMETDEEESENLLDELLLPHERADQGKAASASSPTKPCTIEKRTEEALEKDPRGKFEGVGGARNSAYAP